MKIIQDTVISFYKFVPVREPAALRSRLWTRCRELGTKGTILIAKEGINGMVSGSAEAISELVQSLRSEEGFEDLDFKESFHQAESFRRMLVKVKKYIITLRLDEDVDPRKETGHYLDPLEFKKWQDQGREMVIVDTRNDYEVALGTFRNALDPKIKSFDQFPDWVREHLQDAKDKVVVTFCTGGVRCEKATAVMMREGFQHVYQLEGGILRYFEKTMQESGDRHWEGDCVVFDKRKAITPDLQPTKKEICYVCLCELTDSNRHAEPFPAGVVCQHCGDSMQQHHKERQQKGLLRHHKNLEKRSAFLAEERKRYAVKQQMRDAETASLQS
ncbi:MAG: rhodanese-related sulfurtransferase [Deltaproteobacteria bacterium]|nr:rhodanese-related sulfurtransferase [Deltaproteobacteria bacterium]